MRYSNEFKTGMMVLVSLVILVAMVLNVVDFGLESKGYHVKVLFKYGGGVLKNAPVRLAGVDVGKVSAVDIIYDDKGTHVQLDLLLSPVAKIRKNSRIYIATLGLMGEKYVEISGGTTMTEYVTAESVLEGENPPQMQEIIENTNRTLAQIEMMTKSLNTIFVENREYLNETVSNFKLTSINMVELSEDIKTHPWKLFIKEREKKNPQLQKQAAQKQTNY